MTDTNPIKSWRKAMGLKNQQQAADALGYSLTRVKELETKQSHKIRKTTLLAMQAIYYGLKPWGR